MVNDLPTWAPQVQDVANRLIARTRQVNGQLAGTFNSLTLPTDTQVQAIINQETAMLVPRLGDVPDRLSDSATAIASLKAACEVERSYFMEQINTEMSPYKDMMTEFICAMKDWDLAATGDIPNAERLASLPCGTLYPGYAYTTW